MLLSLLRTAAPRRVLLQPTPALLLRPLTTAAATPAPAQPEPPSAKPPAATTSRPGPPDPRLPYTVSRTPFGKLSVYALNKRGGSLKLTVVKKVEGDKVAFKKALMDELRLEADQVRVKQPTGHIEVSGSYAAEITSWLAKQGF
ncbi:mitochondrial large subunit ribosomal protein-domain-containing protein [Podospora conica]|nr:mitochondrial large subunit ribosomal protein-domain-containing protein [Schizothecium conicum]